MKRDIDNKQDNYSKKQKTRARSKLIYITLYFNFKFFNLAHGRLPFPLIYI